MEVKTFVKGPLDANNYLIIDEKTKDAVLIDCSSPDEDFIQAVKALNINLKYILLTHGHFDHILGIDKFKEIFGVKVLMNKEDIEQVDLAPIYLERFMNMEPVKINHPTDFIQGGEIINIGDINIKAISTPGHTKGGMSYLIDNKLFSGDTLFRGSVGRSDLQGGSFKSIVNSIKNILFNLPDDTIVYPGHGSSSTIDYEKKYNEILNV